MSILQKAKNAREASLKLASATTKDKNNALKDLAKSLQKNKKIIFNANKKDLSEAEKLVNQGKLTKALHHRLKIDNNKFREMIKGVKTVSILEDPAGKTLSAIELDKGMELYKVTVPIGVIAAIFESRPDVAVQISSLAIKSGNAVLLKGGSEAKNTNKAIVDIIRKSISANLPKDAIQLIETREEVKELLKLNNYISLVIPRGSSALVKYVQANTKIPVLGHAEGICHVFVDKNASINMAVKIAVDAKTQYCAVCNAMETLLVDKAIAKRFLPVLIKKMQKFNVELRGDEETIKILKDKSIRKATEQDWKAEYSDLILSIKVVNNADDAISHINKYSSGHTDAIVTKNKKTAQKFLNEVDSACVFWNASTRFSDGYRFGLGAEVGISTNKIHARGPVGLEGLVIYKYILKGKGQIVKPYAEGKKGFTHKKLMNSYK